MKTIDTFALLLCEFAIGYANITENNAQTFTMQVNLT